MNKIIIFLLFAFIFTSCSNEEPIKDDFAFERFKLGEKISLENVHGGNKTIVRTEKGFVIEGEEDKFILFDFFGTFCQPCKEEAAFLTDLWKENSKHLVLIGLDHFEEVSDDEVKKFAHDYGAYYFLSNSPKNQRIISQILEDINYANMEQLPFKVLLYKGEYQTVSDYYRPENKNGLKFYLGSVPISVINNDINTILNAGVT